MSCREEVLGSVPASVTMCAPLPLPERQFIGNFT
jgi:hypothetical protein